MRNHQKQRGPFLIDKAILSSYIQSVKDERIKMAISMYYTLLDQEMYSTIIEPKEGWSFRSFHIDPLVHVEQNDIIIGAKIRVGFMCDLFHQEYSSAFEITVGNRLDKTDQCHVSGEIRRDISVDLVRDEDLSAFKLIQRKVYRDLKELLENLWIEKVIPAVASTMLDDKPQRITKQEAAPSAQNFQVPMTNQQPISPMMMGTMSPGFEEPSLFSVNMDGEVDVPLIGNLAMNMQRSDQATHQQYPAPSPVVHEDEPVPDSNDDLDDDIDIKIAGRVPTIDDDEPPPFSPQMLRKDS